VDLYLILHCKAQDGYADDEERPLTASGRHAAREVGRALKKEGVHFDQIVSSPLVRAVETAELIAVATDYAGELAVARAISPEGRPGKMIDVVASFGQCEHLALVGHEPSMGNLLSRLLEKPGLSLKKGAIVKLEWEPDEKAKLIWVISPKQLEPDKTLGLLLG
jgi:phosphohistidine phosphatase